MKGLLEGVLAGMESKWERPKKVPKYFHPGETASISVRAPGSKKWISLGVAGRLHPATLKAMDIKGSVLAFDWSIEAYMMAKSAFRFEAIAKFPGSERDLSVVVADEVISGDLIGSASGQPSVKKLLKSAEVFDVYAGKGVEKGFKSVSIRFEFQSPERTLKDVEVDVAMKEALAVLKKDFGAQSR